MSPVKQYEATVREINSAMEALRDALVAVGECVIRFGVAVATAVGEYLSSPSGQLLRAWMRVHLVENVDEEWERVATRWGKRYGTAANGG